MTDKPNCRNCHAIHDDRCPIEFATDKCDAYRITQITGCLFHPGAREYLMKDVIKELEQNVFDIESIAEDGYSARAEGIKKAILLIRDGVKK